MVGVAHGLDDRSGIAKAVLRDSEAAEGLRGRGVAHEQHRILLLAQLARLALDGFVLQHERLIECRVQLVVRDAEATHDLGGRLLVQPEEAQRLVGVALPLQQPIVFATTLRLDLRLLGSQAGTLALAHGLRQLLAADAQVVLELLLLPLDAEHLVRLRGAALQAEQLGVLLLAGRIELHDLRLVERGDELVVAEAERLLEALRRLG